MLFNSQVFICFFLPVVLSAYYALSAHRAVRQALVIVASMAFYAWWDVRFVPLLAGLTLANWLVAHHYTDGLAGYWQSNATTVASGGKVQVTPIAYQATGQWSWESSADWYQASDRRTDFVVAVADPTATGVVTTAAALRSFGRPAHQYQVGQYVVMVYDYNLLTRLG